MIRVVLPVRTLVIPWSFISKAFSRLLELKKQASSISFWGKHSTVLNKDSRCEASYTQS